MAHRTDYRIIKIEKEGYYKYYRVQQKCLLFFWIDCSRAFDDVATAERWIIDDLAVETKEVVQHDSMGV